MQSNKHKNICFLLILLLLVTDFLYTNICKQFTIYFKFYLTEITALKKINLYFYLITPLLFSLIFLAVFLMAELSPCFQQEGTPECASKCGSSRSHLGRVVLWKYQISHWHNNNCCHPGNSSVQSSSVCNYNPAGCHIIKWKITLKLSLETLFGDFSGKACKPLNLDNSAQTWKCCRAMWYTKPGENT